MDDKEEHYTMIVRSTHKDDILCLFDMSCGTLCNPTDYSTSVFPILHYLPEFIQTHIHWVDDAIQPSHPLSSPSPPTFRVFPSIRVFSNELVLIWPSRGQSIGVSASASVLPMYIQGLFPLNLIGLISLKSQGLSRVFSSTTVQKNQFFGTQLSSWSNSYIPTWLL